MCIYYFQINLIPFKSKMIRCAHRYVTPVTPLQSSVIFELNVLHVADRYLLGFISYHIYIVVICCLSVGLHCQRKSHRFKFYDFVKGSPKWSDSYHVYLFFGQNFANFKLFYLSRSLVQWLVFGQHFIFSHKSQKIVFGIATETHVSVLVAYACVYVHVNVS